MDAVELLLHPVRLRIVHALSGGTVLSTAEIVTRLSGVSQATVYRQVALLAEGGILEVDGEQRVRGFVERRYRLRQEKAMVDASTAASATVDDHRRIFPIAMAVLLAEFEAYLSTPGADPAKDQVGYRQHVVYMSDEERAGLIEGLREAILPVFGNQPEKGRKPYFLSPLLFPAK
jgi:DNA-binding transcriptional ArsR family regulator